MSPIALLTNSQPEKYRQERRLRNAPFGVDLTVCSLPHKYTANCVRRKHGSVATISPTNIHAVSKHNVKINLDFYNTQKTNMGNNTRNASTTKKTIQYVVSVFLELWLY